MESEIYVSLVIEEESVGPELLDLFKEIGATALWSKGQSRGESIATHQDNGCAFEAKPVISLSVEDVINDFWDYIKKKRELLKIIEKHGFAPVLSVAVYTDEIMPSIHFESYILKEFSQFNIGIDVDIILSE